MFKLTLMFKSTLLLEVITCHNLGTFYARNLKFGMLLTQT